ncbi:MAG TPA: CaiB/BaiF CoA-transferase family protein [Alphaproteobacteria bacterium]
MAGPLSHIRVLDLSRVLAGPWAGQVLADLGAEVIKVEKPGVGDDTRGWGPPFLKDKTGRDTPDAAYFFTTNRGKKSLTLDIAKPEGQEIARTLAIKSDILLENYKVGGLKRYGLDYVSLHKLNPRLIYASITGFGQTGPYAERAGYDFMIQGMGGFMSVTGEADDKPGGGPQKIGVALCDVLTGLFTSTAVLAALAHRERTGEGQHIDMALFDVTVAAMANQATNYLIGGMVPGRMGNAHPNLVPYNAFATADHYIIVAVGNDEQFARLAELLGRPDLARDPRYATNAARVANRDALLALLTPLFKARDRASWLDGLEKIGVPGGPINDIAQALAEPQARARGLRIELPHPVAGTVPLVASPIRMSETPVEYRDAGPMLGEHTDEVLRDLAGLSDAEIAKLRAAKVV